MSELSAPSRDGRVALLLALAAAALRLPRLGFPAEEIFDEVYHAKTALQYLQGENPVEWVHPPTAKLLIAVGVWLWGYESWAWRLLPALAGIALAPVFYLLARRVLATERAAVLASVLLLADGVYLVQSRTAMTNIFAVLFQLGAALFLVRAVLKDPLPVREMLLGGLFLGLALSTRWTSLWATGFLFLVLLAVRRLRLLRPRELALAVAAFGLLPLALYVLSYVPWMRQGHAMTELPEHTKAIWNYHAGLVAEHPYFSKWYTWPWLYRPTWYYFNQTDTTVRGIVALGNPALWWVALPAAAWALVAGAREKDPRLLFAGFGFSCLYLPWGISPRTLNYSHYLFEGIPYACLALGALLDRHWRVPVTGPVARGYVALVVALFLFFVPFLTALPVPRDWFYYEKIPNFRPWTWFSTWV
ncbi:MAG TPA: phospholipid carrier-dependent glycosyltransferase [Vicinamibacteria bacterium]|nr:phospholipid carrier-dependent glycosyltransferase [Vicinamibacteria bacterium]